MKLHLLLILILIAGCAKQEVVQMGTLKLTSTVFENNGMIPEIYTCDGDDINPPLTIEGIPKEAKSLVLIVDDPDAPAGTWDHWVVWNIPIIDEIEEDSVPGMQGLNSFGKHDYGGPCPPSGTHRYMFKLYALDVELDLEEDANKADVEKAMQGHIIDSTTLIGKYSK
jgi:Raf kinase inhibitor-like YbhB/YbcL family protein